ncbi:DUF808 domain-containing protein [Frigidibacter oleivorans]|uniref:DUF808 domain-containing protein n=1 Tax=Frigidibacter oleivorans TaxID=2487129 RepID=UPI000F8CA9A9|nr:DUF808 domain-containing protein [Frigidibacter oleivorans]
MSGLLALLDDVAGIAKAAAASVDDVAGMAGKAGMKAAGVVIDDAAVTPKYVHGFEASRELPIIWRISLGSLRNKLVILLPLALILSHFAPWAITPLLMVGGAYLCFEGAEKVHHWLFPHPAAMVERDLDVKDPAHLEEEKVAGAIKTDFILSAEIMTIALNEIGPGSFVMQAVTLAVVGVAITALVYGGVALIVKMDDVGLHLAREARTGAGRGLGRGLVRAMPRLMAVLSVVGTAAMIWVGGAIVIHGLEEFGLTQPGHAIEHMAEVAAHALPVAGGFVHWAVTAFFDGIFGLILGMLLIPVAARVIEPAVAAVRGKKPGTAGGH